MQWILSPIVVKVKPISKGGCSNFDNSIFILFVAAALITLTIYLGFNRCRKKGPAVPSKPRFGLKSNGQIFISTFLYHDYFW